MASIGIPALTFASGVVLPFSDCITALLWSARTSHSSSNTGDPDEPSLGSVAYSMRARSGASRSNVFFRNARRPDAGRCSAGRLS